MIPSLASPSRPCVGGRARAAASGLSRFLAVAALALAPLSPALAQHAGHGHAAAAPAADASCPPLLRHTFNQLQDGQPQSLCQYRGKVILVVNTASKCGYTKQFEALESMYGKYKDRGLVVIGFPSNDFGQEPASNKEIAEFCRTTYGVKFPLFEKGAGGSLASNPFYVDLAKATGQPPKWNFYKYVVDRDGKPVASFKSDVTPDSRELTALIERLLASKPAA